MTTQVRRLEAAGLVSRTPDPQDARAVRIAITAQGRAMLAQVRADRAAVIDPYLATLPDDDRRLLRAAIGALQHLVADLSADGP
jgi:DNA-binding MarR family transcriptional regulator